MTPDVVYLPPCAALPLLLIRELFGTGQLTWNSDRGVDLSIEKVSVEVNGNRYFLPILKNEYVSPKLFLNAEYFPQITRSLFFRTDGEAIVIGGPTGMITRSCELFGILPVVWISANDGISESSGSVTLKTATSTHIFHSISIVKASHNRSSLILPENWIPVTGTQNQVTIDVLASPQGNDYLIFNRIITENDIRVAKRKNQTIKLDESSRLTPAASDLGKDLKIFR